MRELIVAIALVVIVLTYVLYSVHEQSWFNLLTPQFFIAVPSLYVAQIFRLRLKIDVEYDVWAWCYVYACYSLPFLCFAVALVYLRVPKIMRLPVRASVRVRYSPIVFLVIGFIFYMPVAIEFSNDIFNPRAIYEKTRTGYGLYFFLSSTFSTLAFVLQLFRRSGFINNVVFFLVCVVFSLAHGSKGQILLLPMIWLIFWRYVQRGRLGLARSLGLGTALVSGLMSIFILFSTGIGWQDLGDTLAAYSDFTANGLMVVSDDRPAELGRLVFEDNVYSRVPRALFPDKPKDFGSFSLAKSYFPESFELDQGAPAFGIGVIFADFKFFTLPIFCLTSIAIAMLVRAYKTALTKNPHPAEFIVFAFLCGAPLLSVGVGYLLPEHIIIGWFVAIILRYVSSRSYVHRIARSKRRIPST